MILFLLLVIAAIGLGVAGAVVKAVFYLWIIGAVVFVLALVYLGAWLSRHGQRPSR